VFPVILQLFQTLRLVAEKSAKQDLIGLQIVSLETSMSSCMHSNFFRYKYFTLD